MNELRRFTPQNASRAEFIPVVRELVRAYQAFVNHDARMMRKRGLTVAQADVIFALGNTGGMTFKELGEATLITKGTLTGVVDRLETKGLAQRVPSDEDRRRTLAVLTPEGVATFEEVFPEHVGELQARFDALTADELEQARTMLVRLRELLS